MITEDTKPSLLSHCYCLSVSQSVCLSNHLHVCSKLEEVSEKHSLLCFRHMDDEFQGTGQLADDCWSTHELQQSLLLGILVYPALFGHTWLCCFQFASFQSLSLSGDHSWYDDHIICNGRRCCMDFLCIWDTHLGWVGIICWKKFLNKNLYHLTYSHDGFPDLPIQLIDWVIPSAYKQLYETPMERA